MIIHTIFEKSHKPHKLLKSIISPILISVYENEILEYKYMKYQHILHYYLVLVQLKNFERFNSTAIFIFKYGIVDSKTLH